MAKRIVGCGLRGLASLSVAALLKAHLTDANHAALLEAVAGKTVEQAREVLACWFPKPDVPSSIRKLPVRTGSDAQRRRDEPVGEALIGGMNTRGDVMDAVTGTAAAHVADPQQAQTHCRAREVSSLNEAARDLTIGSNGAVMPVCEERGELAAAREADDSSLGSERRDPVCAATPASGPRRSSTSRSIEPLAPDRYKIQFSAGGDLKRKLELARDLLRHAIPDGDLATILGRALDALIDQVMKRRFASTAAATMGAVPSDDALEAEATTRTECLPHGEATEGNHRTPAPPSSSRRRRPANSVRRAVVARDGARCTWQGPDGRRCGSRAWLEHDHVTPFGQGGDSTPFNTRLLCRPHNRLAAEQAYGQATVTRIIAGRRRARQQRDAELRARDVAEGGTMDSAPPRESQRTRQDDSRGRHER